MPLEVDLLITNRCPCRCDFCYTSAGEALMEEPSPDRLRSFFGQIAEWGVREIHITGGEPFMRNDLEEIVRDGVQAGLMVKVNTSGVGVTRERLEELQRLGLKWIGVPVEGVNPMTQDRGKKRKGAHAAALFTLTTALSLGIKVEVTTLITEQNRAEMPQLALFLSQFNIQKVTTFYYSTVNRGARNASLQPTIADYLQTVSLMEQALKREKKELNLSCEWPEIVPEKSAQYPCRILSRNYCTVLPDGRVYTCPLLILSPLELGNAWETPLPELWNDERRWEIFDRLGASPQANCPANCKGGCPAYTWLQKGDFAGCDPRCRYHQTRRVPVCVIHVEHLLGK